MSWQLSWLCFAGAFSFGFLYLASRQVKHFFAWAQREAGPKERVGVFLPLVAAVGFFAGGIATPIYGKAVICAQQGKPVVSCIFFENP